MILADYEATYGDAAQILVPNVRTCKVFSGFDDIAESLWEDGILTDGRGGYFGSIGFKLASDVAAAINESAIFQTTARVVAEPVFYADESPTAELLVSPSFERARRVARVGTRFEHGVKCVYYKRLESLSKLGASRERERVELLTELLANGTIDDCVVSELEIEFDDDQLARELIFCATIEITFETYKGA